METFLSILKDYGWLIAFLATIGIEIAPIKINPIKWIGTLLGNFLGLGVIKKDIKSLKETVDWNDIDTVRNRISAFENLVRLDTNKNQLKKHQYITALKDIDKWKYYHTVYKNLNGEMNLAIQNIEESYKIAKFDD